MSLISILDFYGSAGAQKETNMSHPFRVSAIDA